MARRGRLRFLARRLTMIGAALCLAVTIATPAQARTVPTAAPDCSRVDDGLRFDGGLRSNDAAFGVPGEDLGTIRDAGLVEVRYTCGAALAPQALTLPVRHAGDRFGTSMAATWLNDDDYEDLLVGVPGLDVGSAANAGGVAVFEGSPTGLHYARTLTQASPGVPGTVQAGAAFGSAVSTQAVDRVVDPNSDTVVRIGEPGHNVGAARAAGGFVDLVYRPSGLVASRTREVTLATAGVPGTPAAGDRLGSALFLDRRVGAPGKAVSGHPGAGAVLATDSFRPWTLVTQDTPGMPGSAESGDGFGSAVAGDWIGVPGEDVGTIVDAGMVERWGSGGPASWVGLTQDTHGVTGVAEAGDHFGAALGEFADYSDDTTYAPRAVLIGVPGEDIGSVSNAGTVDVMAERLDEGEFTLGAGLGAVSMTTPTAGAHFGSAIAQRRSDEVDVGAPGAGSGSGRAYGYTNNYRVPRPALVATWSQQTGKHESGDAFGAAFATTPR